MAASSPLELRVELYVDGPLDGGVVEKISGLLAQRWPVTWDVKVPPRTTLEHPARWHAVIPPQGRLTPQGLHELVATDVMALDSERRFHLRTRWDFPQTPNEQEIYEVNWKPAHR